jgi:hypothetical protein
VEPLALLRPLALLEVLLGPLLCPLVHLELQELQQGLVHGL